MNKIIISGLICLTILFSAQSVYGQEEPPLPEGKNIKEWASISVALVSENRFEEAITYLDKILEQEPDNLKAMSNKAGLLIQLGKFSESLEFSNRVLESDPDRVSTLTNKAIALKNLKEYEKSFLVFSKILSLEPDNNKIEEARAELLSNTPTVPTTNSKYDIHVLVTVRDQNGNLIAITESKNARYLPSIVTEKYWERLIEDGRITISDDVEIFSVTNSIIAYVDHLGFIVLEREMSGSTIHIFEAFIPMIPFEETDSATVQWTILKK